jgi:hypothetical protein
MSVPSIALSIRQPWAWLILNGGKDIENRTWRTNFRGRVLVHASKGMTNMEWEDAFDLALHIDPAIAYRIPRMADELMRGGIVGEVEIVDCVSQSDSRWFGGPCGFVLRNAKPLPFTPCRGALGFFNLPVGLSIPTL